MATLIGERLGALVVLGVERTAEEIIVEVERTTQGLVRLRVEALRVALSTMESEGLLRSCKERRRGQGQRPIKRYTLTQQGVREARSVAEVLRAFLSSGAGAPEV